MTTGARFNNQIQMWEANQAKDHRNNGRQLRAHFGCSEGMEMVNGDGDGDGSDGDGDGDGSGDGMDGNGNGWGWRWGWRLAMGMGPSRAW